MKKNLLLIVGLLSCLSLLFSGCDNGTKSPSIQKVSEIKFEQETVSLSVGESLMLKLNVAPKEATLDVKSIVWTSSDPNVVSVKEGTITAVAEGKASITAKLEGLEAKCLVEVKAKGFEVDFQIVTLEKTSATIKIVPKDPTMRYYYYAMTQKKYQTESSRTEAGIYGFEKSWFMFLSEANPGKTWQELFLEDCTMGPATLELPKPACLSTLDPDSTYVVYAYAVNDQAEQVGGVKTLEFTTKSSEKKNIKFDVRIENVYMNGVDALIKPSTHDKYSVTVQKKKFVDFYREKNMEYKMAKMIIEADLLNNFTPYLVQGEFRLTPEYRQAFMKNTDYYVVVFAYDEENGVGSDLTYVPFHTKSE